MTIVEFLEARISEDEAAARAAAYEPDPDYPVESDNPWGSHGELANRGGDMFRHVLRHDPARVLAECEAKRAIIKMHEDWPVLVQSAPHPKEMGTSDSLVFRVTQQMQWLTSREYVKRFGTEPPTAPMLAALAKVYKDHPDYLEEWA